MRRNGVLSVAVATVCVGIGLAAPGWARPAAMARVTSGGNGWLQVSSGGLENIDEIDAARFGDEVQLVWIQPAGGGSRLVTRILSTRGASVTSPATVAGVGQWAALNEYPSIYRQGDARVISFSGIHDTSPGTEYNNGNQFVAVSNDGGRSFTLSTQVLSNSTSAYASYGSDTALSGSGQPVQVFTAGSTDAISYHVGYTTYPPGTTSDPTTTSTGANVLYAGVATDVRTGRTWTAWYDDDETAAHAGVHAQEIQPSLGSALHAPDSWTTSGGTPVSVAANQRIDVAARSGGGLFIGYGVGYPSATKVALWRLGSSSPLMVPSHGDATRVDAIAGAGGRVWLLWHNVGADVLDAARTNASATRLGATCRVPTPNRDTDVFAITGDGTSGRLLAAINASGGASTTSQVYSRVIQPCLTVVASPTRLRVHQATKVTVKVLDAGDPVPGAKVSALGHTATTDKHGVAVLRLKPKRTGKVTVTVRRSGYQVATVTLHAR